MYPPKHSFQGYGGRVPSLIDGKILRLSLPEFSEFFSHPLSIFSVFLGLLKRPHPSARRAEGAVSRRAEGADIFPGVKTVR